MSRKSKKHARRSARENALALLYSGEIVEQAANALVERGAYPTSITLSAYSESLIEGVCAHREEIDRHLIAASENWTLDRMPVIDRTILRLAIYEMMFVDDVPISVAINEAVELAKLYGGEDDSSRFVNGVLGKIARAIRDEAAIDGEAADGFAEGAEAAEVDAEVDGVEDGVPAEGDEGAEAESEIDTDGVAVADPVFDDEAIAQADAGAPIDFALVAAEAMAAEENMPAGAPEGPARAEAADTVDGNGAAGVAEAGAAAGENEVTEPGIEA